MPRLFPNLGRSSKENAQDAFARHDLYEQKYAQDGYGYGYGYEQEPLLAPTPTRPRMSPSKEPRIDGRAYYGEGEIPGFQRTRSYRTATDDYCESQCSSGTFPAMPYARSDETESYDHIPSHPYSPVPMVQREDSLTRLREAFADNGTYTPGTMTEATTPVPDHIPDMGQFSYGTPGPQRWRAPPVEMRTVEEVKRGPVLVDNAYGPFEGIRPVVRQAPPRQRRPLPPIPPPKPPVAPAQKWEVYPAEDDEGYPSVVIAVQRGGYGQKDTYYIIPGGAPVIFEDEEGNEITRVGDFSGNYRPPPNPRPVIVQDEYGREICRAGFSDDRSLGRTKSDDSNYYNDQRRRDPYVHYRHEYRPERGFPYPSYPYHEYDDFEEDRRYGPRRPYYEDRGRAPTPKVVYIDPTRRITNDVYRPNLEPRLSDYRGDGYRAASGRPRGQHGGSPSFIDLDQCRHERSSASGSSKNSGSLRSGQPSSRLR